MKKLAGLLKLTQAELKNVLFDYLKEQKMSTVCEDGFIYAEGDIPILLVAHMDTVLPQPPQNIYYSKKDDEIFSYDSGIGGDDRCGVYAILKILENFKPHVLFTEDEEIGGIGAEKAVKKLVKPNVKYIIEFDRRGNNDCVFYDCGNNEFMNYIESFGFITDYGTFSDICILGKAWDIASVNLSSCYYCEHTKYEYIKFNELKNNINRVESILEKYKEANYFDYQKIEYLEKEDYSEWYEPYLMDWITQMNVNLKEKKKNLNKKMR